LFLVGSFYKLEIHGNRKWVVSAARASSSGQPRLFSEDSAMP
jgi:hypothetical protein